jgi:roadblock/LC7 domain-containing protein
MNISTYKYIGPIYRITVIVALSAAFCASANAGLAQFETESTSRLPDLGYEPIVLAQVEGASEQKELSPKCAVFAKDPNADIGEIIKAGCEPTLAQMSALMDNPLGNVAMLFTQFDFAHMENPSNGKTATKGNYMGIFQFPKKLNDDWNLISRVVWNVPSMPLDQDKIDSSLSRSSQPYSGGGGTVISPGFVPAPIDLFDGRTTGFGDMYYNGLFAPSKGIPMANGNFLWGAGVNFGFPTASESILGTGKWLAGPSALGVYMGPKWKVGGLIQQYYDVADEEDDRADVNLMNLQYFLFYSLNETDSIGAAPNIIADWNQDSDNAYTVPIGIGYAKTVQFGKIPVRFGVEVHYSVIQPDDLPGSEWNIRFYMIPAAPSALFGWMQ